MSLKVAYSDDIQVVTKSFILKHFGPPPPFIFLSLLSLFFPSLIQFSLSRTLSLTAASPQLAVTADWACCCRRSSSPLPQLALFHSFAPNQQRFTPSHPSGDLLPPTIIDNTSCNAGTDPGRRLRGPGPNKIFFSSGPPSKYNEPPLPLAHHPANSK